MSNKTEPVKDAILQTKKDGIWENVNTNYLEYNNYPSTTTSNDKYTKEQAFSMKQTYELIFPKYEFRVVKQSYTEYE